ncbi:MAG TPA: biotin/lipoyl-containing protein, partial [Kofleriaceae bacterium]
MADLVVPQLGESISEAVVSRWLKNVGDAVTVDEPVAELETDKITVQLPSPVAGALSEQRFAAGATVKVGDVIGAVEAGKQGKAAAPPAKAAPPPREVVTAQPP